MRICAVPIMKFTLSVQWQVHAELISLFCGRARVFLLYIYIWTYTYEPQKARRCGFGCCRSGSGGSNDDGSLETKYCFPSYTNNTLQLSDHLHSKSEINWQCVGKPTTTTIIIKCVYIIWIGIKTYTMCVQRLYNLHAPTQTHMVHLYR